MKLKPHIFALRWPLFTLLDGHPPGWPPSWIAILLDGHPPGWPPSWRATLLDGHLLDSHPPVYIATLCIQSPLCVQGPIGVQSDPKMAC